MSRTFHNGERRIRVRGVRRKDPDLRKLARALIELARAQTEAEAQQQHEASEKVRTLLSPAPPAPRKGAA